MAVVCGQIGTPEAVRAQRRLDTLALVEPIKMDETLLATLEVSDFSDVPPELTRVRIPARRYAVFTHRGHISQIRRTWHTIWSSWLPKSGHEVADAPDFERYGESFDPLRGTGGLEIWIPLKV